MLFCFAGGMAGAVCLASVARPDMAVISASDPDSSVVMISVMMEEQRTTPS